MIDPADVLNDLMGVEQEEDTTYEETDWEWYYQDWEDLAEYYAKADLYGA